MSASLFRLAVLNTTRKPSRTILTAGMIVAGTAMLLVALSWINGIFGSMTAEIADMAGHVRVVDADFAAREQLQPMYENIADVQPVLEALQATEGIVAAYPRITTGVTLSVGEEIGDVFALVQGAPEAYFHERLKVDEHLAAGRWLQNDDELVIGAKAAEQAGAKLGDEVILLGMTQDGSMSPIKGELVGVLQSGNALLDRGVFITLERAQWLTDIPAGAIEILAYGADRDDAPALAAAVSSSPALDGLVAQAWMDRDPWNAMLTMVSKIRGFLAFCIVFMAALGVWNTMMMSVLERTAEVGVLRAMGMSRFGAVMLFVGEAAAIAVIGGLVGVALGAGPAWYLESHGLHLSEQMIDNLGANVPLKAVMRADLSWANSLQAFGLGLAMAILGSALPALRAASIQPVCAMRTGR